MEHKIVVVGDGAVGKSCMLISYFDGTFPRDYVPTVFDNDTVSLVLDNKPTNFSFWDTGGQEGYARIRTLSYPNTNLFMICFSVVSLSSFYNVKERWLVELQHHSSAPYIIVGTKTDLRGTTESTSYEDGVKLAAEIGAAGYFECSALTRDRLKSVFDNAYRLAVGYTSDYCAAPTLPKPAKAPSIDILNATISKDLDTLVDNPMYSDIKFRFNNDTQEFPAHRALLCSASVMFRRILHCGVSNDESPISHSVICSGRISPFSDIQIMTDGKIEMRVNNTTHPEVFKMVVEFMYSGNIQFARHRSAFTVEEWGFSKSGSPHKEILQKIISVAEDLQIEHLAHFCRNILSDETFLNPSITTYINDCTAEITRKMFVKSEYLSDLSLRLGNSDDKPLIPIHKAYIAARCKSLYDIITSEDIKTRVVSCPDAKHNEFVAFLEYLYTEHAPIEQFDMLALLCLANTYQVPRLITLCELYVTKFIERETAEDIATTKISVVDILNIAQANNAPQLAKFCLHFLATNYSQVINRPDFFHLSKSNLIWIQKNQWPPESYYTQLAEYEATKRKKKASKRKIKVRSRGTHSSDRDCVIC